MLRNAVALVVLGAMSGQFRVRAAGTPGQKSDRLLEPANMRCFGCGAHRDEAIASTQGKGAGKGQSSTGSGAAAGTARREDDARIAELREVIRTFTEEVGALRRDLTHLRSDFLNLQARVQGWERW